MKYTLTFLLLIFSLSEAFATSQLADLLIYKGDTLSLCAAPLELFYQDDCPMPVFFEEEEISTTSNCWRAYQAEWSIINQQLYLTGIFSCGLGEERLEADLAKFFPKKYTEGKVKADWVTTNSLSLECGMLYSSYYPTLAEKDLGFEFEKGLVVQTFKRSEKNKQLIDFIYRNLNWEIFPKEDEKIAVFVRILANANGLIEDVVLLRGGSEVYENEVVRVLKMIPDQKIYYRNLVLKIVFSPENRAKYQSE